MDKGILIAVAVLGLTLVNIAGFKYMGLFGGLVTAASVPFAQELLKMIREL